MIAMSLINNPDLLIADEPTTALDVTTQAQILTLIEKLQEEFGSAVIMITHDLGVVAEIADDVVVMYAAEVAEKGAVDQIFKKPHHPYTWGLMGSLPRLDADVERLVQIQGQPPSLLRPPSGCRFHPRCPYVMPICKEVDPELAARRRRHGPPAVVPPRRGDQGPRGREAPRRDDGGGQLDGGDEQQPEEMRQTELELTGDELLVVAGRQEVLPGHARDRLPEGSRVGEGGRRRLLRAARGRDPRRRRRVRAAASRRWRAAS